MDTTLTRSDFISAVTSYDLEVAIFLAASLGVSNTTIDLWCISM